MSSDWLSVALLLSEISCSIGSFGMVCKANKVVPWIFIHNHHVLEASLIRSFDKRLEKEKKEPINFVS